MLCVRLAMPILIAASFAIVACKKDDKKSSATPQSKSDDRGGGNRGEIATSPAPSGANVTNRPFEIKSPAQEVAIKEIPDGYYQFTGIRYHALNKSAGLAVKASQPESLQKQDNVSAFYLGGKGAAVPQVQFPAVIVATDKAIKMHDYLMFNSGVRAENGKMSWDWLVSVAALTGNQVFGNLGGLGMSYDYNGKFKSYSVEIAGNELRVVAQSNESTLELTYKKSELTDVLASRPNAELTVPRNGDQPESVGMLNGIFNPINEKASSEIGTSLGDLYPHMKEILQNKDLQAKAAKKSKAFGIWITGTIVEIQYSDRVEKQSSLAWTTDLMKWKQKVNGFSKEQLIDGLKAFRELKSLQREESARDRRQSFVELHDAYIRMTDEAILALQNGTAGTGSGPWEVFQ